MKKIFLIMAVVLSFPFISCGDDKDEPESPDNHEWVDLGLPSGTLWATCNVGADTPEEYGDYFAWGETKPKVSYDWETYKWCDSSRSYTKYCSNSKYGVVDNKTELDPDDDAAYVNWGSSWRMPTKEQQDELREKCSWLWTQRNGVYGQLGTGPNGNTLFLPATGLRNIGSLLVTGSEGMYWSRTLNSTNGAVRLEVYSSHLSWNSDNRFRGYTVRAVRVPQN